MNHFPTHVHSQFQILGNFKLHGNLLQCNNLLKFRPYTINIRTNAAWFPFKTSISSWYIIIVMLGDRMLSLAWCFFCWGNIDQYCFADTIGPADVGLKEEHQEDDRGHGLSTPNTLNRVDRWAQPITYVEVNESQSFTVSPILFPLYLAWILSMHLHDKFMLFWTFGLY